MAEQNGNLAENQPEESLPASAQKEQPEQFVDYGKTRQDEVPVQNVVDWISNVEMDKGIGLSADIRQYIANALTDSETPGVALTTLRDKLLEEKPETNKNAAVVIDEVIKRVAEKAEKVTKAEVFENLIADSLKKYLFPHENKESTDEMLRDAGRIKNIFYSLKSEVEEVGIVTSDLDALQREIDKYVQKHGLDKEVFSGSIKKYLSLLAPKMNLPSEE